jgi:hypothetical protein
MNKPKIGKTYTFVRRREDTFEQTDFTRHEDGSSGFLVDGHYSIFECHPDAWQHALAALAELGFVELSEARKSGLSQPTGIPHARLPHFIHAVAPLPSLQSPMITRKANKTLQSNRSGRSRLPRDSRLSSPRAHALGVSSAEEFAWRMVWPASELLSIAALVSAACFLVAVGLLFFSRAPSISNDRNG